MQEKSLKQVIVVRGDLKMSRGKLAAQVAHASLEAWKRSKPEKREEWEREGGKKIVLEVKGEEELRRLLVEADQVGLPKALIKDAGHTELKPGTVTALGLGPEEEKKMDRVTGELETL